MKFRILISFIVLIISAFYCGLSNDIKHTDYKWTKEASNQDSYEIGKEESIYYKKQPVYYIKSIKDVQKDSGIIKTTIMPNKYLGKYLVISGNIKTENLSGWAGFWLSMDGRIKDHNLVYYDAGYFPIRKNTNWKSYGTTIYVPDSATEISFGAILNGKGKVLISDFYLEKFEQNQIYSEPIDGWYLDGSKSCYDYYTVRKSENITYNQKTAYYLMSKKDATEDSGTIKINARTVNYFGKRIRLTGYIKTENIENWAGMWMGVYNDDFERIVKGNAFNFDNMNDRPIKGTNDWSKYEIVLDVPDDANYIPYGAMIHGNGKLWISDFSIEIVGNDVPLTNAIK